MTNPLPKTPSSQGIGQPDQNQATIFVDVVAGPHIGKKFSYKKGSISLGRGSENDLVLSDDTKASRVHAEILVSLDEVIVTNLSKKNPLLVNDVEVLHQKVDQEFTLEFGESKLRIKISRPDTKDAPGILIPLANSKSPLKNQNSPNLNQHGNLGPIHSSPTAKPSSPGVGGIKKPGRKLNRNQSSPLPLVIILLLIVGGILFLTTKKKKIKDDVIHIDPTIDIIRDEEVVKQLVERKQKLGNLSFQRAQENFIKGFRDYRQGQYGRAMEAFQVVLQLDPENELARKYYQGAKLKLEERLDFHLQQGHRYREKQNWRLCKASFFNALILLQNNQNDPKFKEAKFYYDACSLAQEGRF